MNARVTEPKAEEVTPVSPAAAGVAAAPGEAVATPRKKRSGRQLALLLSVPVVLAAGGAYFFLTGGRYVETDNAYVHQPKVAVSADVAGRVVSVSVHANETARAGRVLSALDPDLSRMALDRGGAARASAGVNVEQRGVAYGTANAQLQAAKAALTIRQSEFDRKDALKAEGLAADATLDDVRLALQAAQTQVALSDQQVAGAVAALAGNPDMAADQHPAVRAALAARDNAARNLAKATVVAPADGIISQVASLNVGQFVAMGTTIASLIETTDTWVEANFKETQLAALAAGMPVEVTVDAYPGVKFEGHLDSIGAATGSEFALIPAQNATGNWVKVTQRVPVRVEVTPVEGKVLRAGMSAVVSVDTKPAA